MATLEIRTAGRSSSPVRLSVLIIGDSERDEFRAAMAGQGAPNEVSDKTHSENTTQLDLQTGPTLALALDRIASGQCLPDLVVLAQSRPGEFSCEDVHRLRRAAPSARISGLLGSWCEGEARSGAPWPGVIRTYWHQWPARFQAEIATLANGGCPAWGLAETAADEERLLASVDLSPAAGPGLIGISSEDREMFAWLAAACQRFGYATLRISDRAGGVVTDGNCGLQLGGMSAAIWDGGGLDDNRYVRLARFAALAPSAPIVALLSFPRIEDREKALLSGAAAILSKPLLLPDLARVLHQSIANAS